MSEDEKKAFQWLIKQGYDKDDIIFQKNISPDFIIGDELFEVKSVYGNQIQFTFKQFSEFEKSKPTILIYREECLEPIVIDDFNLELIKTKGFKIFVAKRVENKKTVMINQDVWYNLTILKIKKNFRTFDDTLNFLIKFLYDDYKKSQNKV